MTQWLRELAAYPGYVYIWKIKESQWLPQATNTDTECMEGYLF